MVIADCSDPASFHSAPGGIADGATSFIRQSELKVWRAAPSRWDTPCRVVPSAEAVKGAHPGHIGFK